MTMQIKTGDRVKFCDKIVRVLKCGNGTSDPSFRLSHFLILDGLIMIQLKILN